MIACHQGINQDSFSPNFPGKQTRFNWRVPRLTAHFSKGPKALKTSPNLTAVLQFSADFPTLSAILSI